MTDPIRARLDYLFRSRSGVDLEPITALRAVLDYVCCDVDCARELRAVIAEHLGVTDA